MRQPGQSERKSSFEYKDMSTFVYALNPFSIQKKWFLAVMYDSTESTAIN